MNDELIYSQEDVEEYLAHHGILGMKWGHQNGPPYPLDSSVSTGSRLKEGAAAIKKKVHDHNVKVKRKKALKKAQETKAKKAAEQKALEAKKKQVADSHSVDQVYENMKLFSDSELKTMLERLNTEQSVRELYNKNHKSDAEKAIDFLNKMALASTSISTITKNIDAIAKVLGANNKKDNKQEEAERLRNELSIMSSKQAMNKLKQTEKEEKRKAKEEKRKAKEDKTEERNTSSNNYNDKFDPNNKRSTDDVHYKTTVEGNGNSTYRKSSNIVDADYKDLSSNVSSGKKYISGMKQLLLEDLSTYGGSNSSIAKSPSPNGGLPNKTIGLLEDKSVSKSASNNINLPALITSNNVSKKTSNWTVTPASKQMRDEAQKLNDLINKGVASASDSNLRWIRNMEISADIRDNEANGRNSEAKRLKELKDEWIKKGLI